MKRVQFDLQHNPEGRLIDDPDRLPSFAFLFVQLICGTQQADGVKTSEPCVPLEMVRCAVGNSISPDWSEKHLSLTGYQLFVLPNTLGSWGYQRL